MGMGLVKVKVLAIVLVLMLFGSLIGGLAAAQDEVVLRVTGPDWAPNWALADISRDFTAHAEEVLGYPVRLEFDLFPWGVYYERLMTALVAGEPVYDIFIADSQWLGDLAINGFIYYLNPILEEDPELREIMDSMHPVLRSAYGSYPDGSKHYWGFPAVADTKLMHARYDLLSHPDERAAFREQYGWDLPLEYEDFLELDWTRFTDILEFFTREAGETLAGEVLESNFYGLAEQYGKEYDMLIMGLLPHIYGRGGDIWDRETRRVQNVLNSDLNVESFEFYISLLEYCPPGAINYTLYEINDAMAAGIVAFAINWGVIAEALYDPELSVVHDKLITVLPPGHIDVNGEFNRTSNIGGQPFVIGSATQHIDEVVEFIKWWYRPENATRFAQAGGLGCVEEVVYSEEFLAMKPWHRAFADSLDHQLDFWKEPPFFEMLTVLQETFHKAVLGEITAREAMDHVAKVHTDILLRWGYLPE
ncbi:MAG TPA: extracellular solute-binding protein [Atribacteraceae bacterium]|nr:extracellular solute-binding protein [Atribacteraceae bacterium]